MFLTKNVITFKSIKCLNRCFATNREQLIVRLENVLGSSAVSTSGAVRDQHCTDEGPHTGVAADVVVWPTTTQHVSAVSKLCYESNVPIIPYGTGTGLEGGVSAPVGGVCVDLSRMNQILELNGEDFDCTVEAGVTWRDLNAYLRDTGLWFTVDPGASASLGGMTATGASGTNSVCFGTMRQNVLNMEVVLADGQVIRTSGKKCRARKSSAGYNLTSLFIGSEGTLGTITKVCLKLHAIPESVAVAVCSFDSDYSAINTVIETLQNSLPIARIEYLDDLSIRACRSYSGVELPEKPTLFLEFNGSSNEEVKSRSDLVQQIAVSNGGLNFEFATDLDERKRLWKARHELFYACLALQPGSKAVITDVCVPVSKLTEMIVKTKELIAKSGLIGTCVGHVGDGNFHTQLFYSVDSTDGLKIAHQLEYDISVLALQLGGTCTGEHGIGLGKMHLLCKQYDDEAIEAMKNIKKAFDPKNLMNPNKIIQMDKIL